MYKTDIKYEIGNNIFISIKNVSYVPGRLGHFSGRPEDCYPDEPAEIDWKDEDCKIVVEFTEPKLVDGKTVRVKKEKEFDCDPELAYHFYTELIEETEEALK